MADFYTNLPPKDQSELDKTIEKLKTTNYETEYEFNAGEYDSAVGFSRISAESTAYVIMAQAKIDNIKAQEILDKLSGADDLLLNELITIILNANRYKSSRLGVRQNLTTKETVSRNIIN